MAAAAGSASVATTPAALPASGKPACNSQLCSSEHFLSMAFSTSLQLHVLRVTTQLDGCSSSLQLHFISTLDDESCKSYLVARLCCAESVRSKSSHQHRIRGLPLDPEASSDL